MYASSRLLSLLLLSLGCTSLAAEPARDRFGDPLPDGAVARLGSLRLRNEYPILHGAFSADGKTLIVCDSNGLSVWDPATGKAVRRVAIQNVVAVRHRRFSADGQTLIQSGYDNVLRFLDTATGAERHTFNHASHGPIQALDVSRDGKRLVAIHQASIALWDVPSGKLLHEFKGPRIVPLSPYGLVALTPDGKQLVLPHSDGSLHLIDTASGKEVVTFEMPPNRPGVPASLRVQRLALSPDGRYLAYGGGSSPLTVCELNTGKRVRELTRSAGLLAGLAFTPNGRFLAVEDYTGMHLFGVLSGKEIRKLSRPPGASRTLIFSPDGRTLAALGGGHTIDLWDVADDRQPYPPIGHPSLLQTLVFFPDGKRLVATDGSGGMIVWDIASGRDLAHLRNGSPSLFPVVDEDGERLRFLSSTTVFRWDPLTGRQVGQTFLAGQALNALALSPDGRSVASMTFQPTPPRRQLHLSDLQDGKARRLPGLPEQAWVSQVVFASDSRRLAAASSDGGLHVWDRDTGQLVRQWKADMPGRRSGQLAFAADGRSLADFDGVIRLREIASGGSRLQIAVPAGLLSLAYSPDGRFLACGQGDGMVRIYGAVTGKELAQWQGKQGGIRALAFRRDGHLLASGGENGTILIWNVPAGEDVPATRTAEQADDPVADAGQPRRRPQRPRPRRTGRRPGAGRTAHPRTLSRHPSAAGAGTTGETPRRVG